MKRPMPPLELADPDDYSGLPQFAPAPDVWEWIKDTIIDEDGALYNPDHSHLRGQSGIHVLWADYPYQKKGRDVAGTAEQVAFRVGGWQKTRQEKQMYDWFGVIPEFLITLAASYCRDCSDVQFCALVEHELYHIAHAIDRQSGGLKFAQSGLAKLEIRGHDVEEFIGVVRRYGGDTSVQHMVRVANNTPEIGRADIAQACGTCLLRLA